MAVLFAMTTAVFSQTLTGTVNAEDGPLPGANILVKGTETGTQTDFDGKFSLNVEAGSGTLVISFVGYANKEVSYTVAAGETKDLGTITLESDNTLEEVVIIGTGIIDLAEDRRTPIAVSTVMAREIQAKSVGNVELTEVIKSTPSVFVANQTGFGDSQLSLRGFDDTNTAVLLNGQPVNSQEDGRLFWSNWAGLSDIATAMQVQRGLGSSKLAISSVGGTVNIVMKAAQREKGGYFRALGGNDSYGKLTFAYDTGKNDNGWAFSVLLDHWQGHRKWSRGTFGQGQNYYFAVGYEPSETHNFNFLITGAPQFHGQKWSQRRDRLEADPKYNQHWGYTENIAGGVYTSEIDSERRNYYHKPVANFNWDWNISDVSTLSSVLYASWGRGGGTGPRGGGRIRTAAPVGTPLQGQLDYAAIEAQAAADNNGIGNESGEFFDSYARRASVNNHQWYGLVSNFNTELSEKVNWNVGVDLRMYTGDHFRQLTDLYGLSGWANDRYDGAVVTATFDPDPWASLFNFADEGERIDYDYSEDINYQGVFSQIEYAGDKFSAFFQGAVSNQSYQRNGRWENQGKSDKESKTGYNLKGGISYTVADMHTFFFNGGYYSRQPFLDNIFRNIRRSNDFFNPGVENEKITGLEVGYNINGQGWRIRINGYFTDWDNRVLTSFGTIDPNNTPNDETDDINVNIFERGVNQLHTGIEVEADYRALSWLTLKSYMSSGNWVYKGTTQTDTFNDDTGNLITSISGRDIDGIKVTRAPQFTAGFGARAKVREGFIIYGNIDYVANHYLTPINFSSGSIPSSNGVKNKPYSLTDVGLSYRFNLGDQALTFGANAYNIFDEVRIQNTDAFGFVGTNGITFNASMRYTF